MRLTNGRPVTARYDTDNHSFDVSSCVVEPGTPAPEHTCGECDRYIPGRLEGNCTRTYGGSTGPLRPACKHFKDKPTTQPTMEKQEATPAPAAENVQEQIPPKTKICPSCGRELPASDFGAHPRTRDRLQTTCRECRSKKVSQAWKEKKIVRKVGDKIPAKIVKADSAPSGEVRGIIDDLMAQHPAPVIVNPTVAEIPDHDLAKELRRRGYNVSATKTIEL